VGKININNLTYLYPEKDKPSLDNITLNIDSGEFVLVLGSSGCGKSTLLRSIVRLIPDFYGGKVNGDVFINNKDISKMKAQEISSKAGFIFQNPENQIIFSEVRKEIVFGMENLNFSYEKMRINLSDVCSYLGINNLLDKKTSELSGGEKQKVSIASILCMESEIILLDEPTSQLDPISAEGIINTIRRLNEDFGITVVMVEHRFDKCFHLADKIVFMEEGKIKFEDKPETFLNRNNPQTSSYIPIISRLFKSQYDNNALDKMIPVTVKDAKGKINNEGLVLDLHNLNSYQINNEDKLQLDKEKFSHSKSFIRFDKVFFSYQKKDENTNSDLALKDISFEINKGEFISIHGEVGAGKSTLFKLITLKKRPEEGKIFINEEDTKKLKVEDLSGKIAYLSQNPGDYLSQDTVLNEMLFTSKHKTNSTVDEIKELLSSFGIDMYLKSHPRDISTGERQRLAIASLLLYKPEHLLLDEPTRGLDLSGKRGLGSILCKLNDRGITITLITHDIEFAYAYAEKSLIMSRGELICFGDTKDVLNQAYSYTTEIGKLIRSLG
jgi:energy-coupling factor transport system ATP-binding protein